MGLDEPIFRDNRGEIRRYEINGFKFNVLYSKKGILRSGDYHPNTQYDFILKGKLEITYRINGKDVKKVYEKNDFIEIKPGIPHLFNFIEDTVMIEWWDGEFKADYFESYRKFIREHSSGLG
ncbi:MAG: hypothetical protein PHG05_04965 [Candidatus Nanoarchaeia archaeon]|nr:hypothetical protein [Candidatus Nanoarchaeia archaeon]